MEFPARVFWTFCFALIALLTGLSCAKTPAGSNASKPEETSKPKMERKASVLKTVEDYLHAVKEGDDEGVYACFVKKEARLMKENGKKIDPEEKENEYRIESAVFEGDVGVVEISFEGKQSKGKFKFYLVEEEGEFKISFEEMERAHERAVEEQKAGEGK